MDIQNFMLKVSKDDKLREELKKNPKETIKKYCEELPTSKIEQIVVLEEKPNQCYFVIPSSEQIKILTAKNEGFKLFKSLEDEKVKEALKKDPKRFLERELKTQFSESLNIQVVEDTDKKMHLIIPSNESPVELTEEETAEIQGGIFPIVAVAIGWGATYLGRRLMLKVGEEVSKIGEK